MFKLIVSAVVIATLAGCVGSNVITKKLMKFNIEVVDNRYARAGVNFLLAPVYGLTTAADYVIFNSLEFWMGKNPIDGSPHIFDTKTKTMLEINDDLDPSLNKAPISSARELEGGNIRTIDESTIEVTMIYSNGDSAVLRGEKQGELVMFYMDGELVSETTITQLQSFVSTTPANLENAVVQL